MEAVFLAEGAVFLEAEALESRLVGGLSVLVGVAVRGGVAIQGIGWLGSIAGVGWFLGVGVGLGGSARTEGAASARASAKPVVHRLFCVFLVCITEPFFFASVSERVVRSNDNGSGIEFVG